MGSVTEVLNEQDFHKELANAGTRLVIVDFTASWCHPCQLIKPIYHRLATKYPHGTFLQIDVDKCKSVATSQGVSAMPTFIFYKNRTKIYVMEGADPALLESKIRNFLGSGSGNCGDDDDNSVEGHMDLAPFITASQCECLNEKDEHSLQHCLEANTNTYLESDCDEQLIISITFNQAVKIHSLRIKGPTDMGPKNIRLFINQPRTLDFEMASNYASVQDLQLSESDCENSSPVNVRYVKFQSVQNIQLFVRDNQSDGDTTRIQHLAIIGSPINTTKMSNFKRVAGKKGESH